MRGLALAALLLAGAAPADDPFDRTLTALARGVAAAGHTDATGRRAAARALRASGAAPVAGSEDLAAAWAGGDAAPERNRALGPGYRALALERAAGAAFAQTFLGGQRARVAVVARPGDAVALRVRDDRGATVCAIGGAPARCDWVPAFTARFAIELRNRGAAAGHYLLVVE